MKKYIFMYNLDEESCEPEIFNNKLNKAGIDFYIEESNIFPTVNNQYKKLEEDSSLWVLEEHYLIAFTILSYENLMGISWYDEIYRATAQDCLDWYVRHNKDDSLYVNYK